MYTIVTQSQAIILRTGDTIECGMWDGESEKIEGGMGRHGETEMGR
jgi:hypothetical protein